jgi:hypothetical protein
MARVTRVVPPEYDNRAAAALYAVLEQWHGFRLWRFAGHGGSQQLDFRWYWVQGRLVRTLRETYFGLKVIGPAPLVDSILAEVHASINVAAP